MEVPRNKKEILIIRLSAMGDVAMTIPVIERLKKDNHEVGITILTSKMVMPLFYHLQGVEVVGWDLSANGSFKDIFKMFKQLRTMRRFDTVIDLHDVLRTKVLRWLFTIFGVKTIKIDKGRKEKRALINKSDFRQLKTTVQRYRDTLSKAGLVVDNTPPKLVKKIMPLPKSILEAVGEKEGIWLGIAPFAKHKGKAYPLDKIEKVMDILAVDDNISFFIFSGGGKERELSKTLAGRYRNAFVVFGKTLLDGELKLISNLDCMVSMDSGAMHFASIVGTPVVSIWGATHPYAGFLGYGQSMENVVQCADMECRPCSVFGDKPCKSSDYSCLNEIKPEDVVKKILRIIK